MKTPRHGAVAIAALTSTLLIAACSNAAEAPAPAEEAAPAEAAADPAATGTIVAVAQGAGSFSTLVTAVQAAGLVDTLNGAGPFTVFAPTDDAFGKVPAATREALLAPAGKADLTRILTYHVVAGRVDAATLTRQIQEGGGSARLTMVEGGVLIARAAADGSVTLTDENGGTATVVQADVPATNGVIHAIDTVVMPN